MKSYYQINPNNDLLDSYDLPEMQMYILILKYLLRMGKEGAPPPLKDWKKVKDLMARVKNHISFHVYGVKLSEFTVDFYSPEVGQLFFVVYGDGSQTWTNDWLDTFESVKDAIDSQVGDNRSVCQYGAASGKRCGNCQCPDPIVSTDEQLMGGIDAAKMREALVDVIYRSVENITGNRSYKLAHILMQKFTITPKTQKAEKLAEHPPEKAKEWSARYQYDTAWEMMMKRNEGTVPAGDTENPRFVVEEIQGGDSVLVYFSITDRHTGDNDLSTVSKEKAVAIAELLNAEL